MKFRIYLNSTMGGPFEVPELCELPGFSLTASVSPDGECDWRPAASYPVITGYIAKKSVSGDYKAEDETPLKLPNTPSQNWRATITPVAVPRTVIPSAGRTGNFQAAGSAEKTAVAVSRASTPRVVTIPLPSDSKSDFWDFSIFTRLRKPLLLVVLGATAVTTCSQQKSNFQMIVDGLVNPDTSAPPLPHQRLKGTTHPVRLLKWLNFARLAVERPSPIVTKAPAKPSEEITEVGSDVLEDGSVRKTVVVTRLVDGVKLSTTKTYMVAPQKQKAHKHRTHLQKTD